MGVGHIRLVDCDVVELSNLHRQYLYGSEHLGHPKAEVAAKRLLDLNPEIELEPLTVAVNSSTAGSVVDGMDVIVDGLDRITPRYALNRACLKAEIPYVFGAAIMTYGTAKTILPHQTACLECFEGGLEDDNIEKCAVVGVHPSVLGIVASVEVSEATRIVMGERPQIADKLFCCDIWDMRFDEVEIKRSETCPACGTAPSSAPQALKEPVIADLCARNGRRVFLATPRRNLDLDLESAILYLKGKKAAIEVKAELGLTFRVGPHIRASLLKSGVMVIEGIDRIGEAQAFYEDMVIENLSVPRSRVYGD